MTVLRLSDWLVDFSGLASPVDCGSGTLRDPGELLASCSD